MNSRPATQSNTPLQESMLKTLQLLLDKYEVGGESYTKAQTYVDMVPNFEEGDVFVVTNISDYQTYGLTDRQFSDSLRVLTEKHGFFEGRHPAPLNLEGELYDAEARGHKPDYWLPGTYLFSLTPDFPAKAHAFVNPIQEDMEEVANVRDITQNPFSYNTNTRRLESVDGNQSSILKGRELALYRKFEEFEESIECGHSDFCLSISMKTITSANDYRQDSFQAAKSALKKTLAPVAIIDPVKNKETHREVFGYCIRPK
jgi:hypothetical protein